MLRLCQQMLLEDPRSRFACTNLGVLRSRAGRYDEAIALYRAGLDKSPEDSCLHGNIARALCERRQWADAYLHAKKGTELDPANVTAWVNLSWACIMLGWWSEAEYAARRTLKLNPDELIAMNNLASAVKEQGRVHEAAGLYREVITRNPSFVLGHGNLLLTLQYDERASGEEIIKAARNFATVFEAPLQPAWPHHATLPAPWRRLRVGFFSPDFNDHSVMYFAEPVLAGLDRQQFEVVCYYLYPAGSGDHITERVKRMSDRFVYLGGCTPDEQARLVQDDGIDILIEMAGHTGKNGLLTMARKPAPVQVTWLGYPGTTGLYAIDWRITDSVADVEPPFGSNLPALQEQYSEKLVLLPPPFCVYRPCIRNPLQRYWPQYQITPAPAATNGFITFGSCNNLAKLTPNVLEAWGKLLRLLPTARLLIEGQGFGNLEAAQAYREKCAGHGIDPQRLDLIVREGKNQYLTYHRIDIALDPFPLTGGTTSFDALWMGVPLVTMEGDSFRSRMSMSLLAAAELSEWITKDEEEYITIAAGLAADIPALNARRLQQRQRIERSPLMDETRFVRLFEKALRQAWLKWCAEKLAPDNPQRQFQQWLQEWPQQQPAEPQVYLAPGELISLSAARKRLGELFTAVTDENGWQEVIRLAVLILESIPKEPMALAALAEADYALGNLQAAISYLSHAVDAAPQQGAFYLRLIHWHREAGNEQGAETIIRLMQQRGVQVGAV